MIDLHVDIKKFIINRSCYSIIKLFNHMAYDFLQAYCDYVYCACKRSLDYIEYGLCVIMGLSHKVLGLIWFAE
jgi:hypothetical protein